MVFLMFENNLVIQFLSACPIQIQITPDSMANQLLDMKIGSGSSGVSAKRQVVAIIIPASRQLLGIARSSESKKPGVIKVKGKHFQAIQLTPLVNHSGLEDEVPFLEVALLGLISTSQIQQLTTTAQCLVTIVTIVTSEVTYDSPDSQTPWFFFHIRPM